MDDFVLIHESKEYLRKCLLIIKNKLLYDYKLELNKKTKIYSIKEGVEFLGFRFVLKENKLILKIKNKTKGRFRKIIRNLKLLKEYGYISEAKYKMIIASLRGHMKYGSCNNLYYRSVND